MTMAELATIAQENLDVNIAIINNGYLGMVRQWQEFFYEKRYAATPLVNPDFAKLADAFGIASTTVTVRGQVADAVQAARRQKRAALIDFKVEQEDSVYPDGAGRRRFAQDDPQAVADCGDCCRLGDLPRRHEDTNFFG
jgi:acetolactate synthase-1/2/3 large subunit